MEIERKWMVNGWPAPGEDTLPLLATEYQEQGYVHTQAPIVRVRLEARSDETVDPIRPGTEVTADSASDVTINSGSAMIADTANDAHVVSNGRSSAAGSVTQAVRKAITDEHAHHVLCFKSAGYLAREEIEIELSKEDFVRLSGLIGQPLIRKVRRIYQLPGDLELEVNLVDEGLPTEFMYAEVEFSSEEQARAWDPAFCGLGDYLADDVTEQPGQSMSAFWARTRGGQAQG